MSVQDNTGAGAWVSLDMNSGHLIVTGHIDRHSAPTIQAELTLLLGEVAEPQVVDLSGVRELTPSGKEAIRSAYNEAVASGVDVTVVAPAGSAASIELSEFVEPY